MTGPTESNFISLKANQNTNQAKIQCAISKYMNKQY